MAQRMTLKQIRRTYPERYVGLRNPAYAYGVLESAEIAYTDDNGMILFWRQITEPDIFIFYTGDNPPMMMNMMLMF